MATKTFYKSVGGKQIARLYDSSGGFSFTAKNGAIPSGSTITNVKIKLWMTREDDETLSNSMSFYYLADYDKCNNKSSSDKYYYIGSSDNHHKSDNDSLKSMTRITTASGKNYDPNGSLSHNYEVSFSRSELSSLNIAFLESKYINTSSVSKNQIRCSNKSSYSSDNHQCWGIEMDITYTEPSITPTAPTFTYPAAASTTTYNQKPWFQFAAKANTSKIYWRVDSGSWQNFSASNGNPYDKQWTTALSIGSHTVHCYSQSSTSTNSGTQSRAFTVASPQAAVTAGSVMDDATIDGLQTNIRNQQAYYGKTQTTFTACNAGTKALDDHIDQMETAIETLPHPTSLSSVDAGTKISASTINAIRTALTNA